MTCTPGPWYAERFYRKHSERLPDGWFWGIDGGDGMGYLAVLPEDDEATAESDARLIAAAPTIVALLRRMAEKDPMEHTAQEDYRCKFCESEEWDYDADEYLHVPNCPWWEAATLLLMASRDGHRPQGPDDRGIG